MKQIIEFQMITYKRMNECAFTKTNNTVLGKKVQNLPSIMKRRLETRAVQVRYRKPDVKPLYCVLKM